MSTKTTYQKVQTFKSRQRKGDVVKLSELTGFSESHISNVLSFRKNNPLIVETAYKMTYRRKATA